MACKFETPDVEQQFIFSDLQIVHYHEVPCGTSSDESERVRAITPAPPSHLRLVTLTGLMTPRRENGYLGPIWTLSLRGVCTFVANSLDINGCVVLF